MNFSTHKEDYIFSTNEMVVDVRIRMCLSRINYIIELLSQVILDKETAAHVDEDKNSRNGIMKTSPTDESGSEVGEEMCFNISKVYDDINLYLIMKKNNYRRIKRLKLRRLTKLMMKALSQV